ANVTSRFWVPGRGRPFTSSEPRWSDSALTLHWQNANARSALALASTRAQYGRVIPDGPKEQAKRSSAAIGEFIREQREQAQVSMRQLARLAGVSHPYLSQIERGLRKT